MGSTACGPAGSAAGGAAGGAAGAAAAGAPTDGAAPTELSLLAMAALHAAGERSPERRVRLLDLRTPGKRLHAGGGGVDPIAGHAAQARAVRFAERLARNLGSPDA